MTDAPHDIPILFSAPMIKALRANRKTQTRRIVKPQPEFIYDLKNGNVTELFINEGVANELDNPAIWRGADAHSNSDGNGLPGWVRWSDLLSEEVRRRRESGFSGLVCFSRHANKPGLFKCLLVPRGEEVFEEHSSTYLHGIPRTPGAENAPNSPSRRQSREQSIIQSHVGDATRELDGSRSSRAGSEGRKTPPIQIDRHRTRPHSLGDQQGIVQPTSGRADARHESGIDTKYCRFWPGLKLWVREACAHIDNSAFGQPSYFQYRADTDGKCLPGDWPDEERGNPDRPRWKPSIHMPRIASRLILEVREVRIERLHSISEEDAIAEGVLPRKGDGTDPGPGCKWSGTGYHGGTLDKFGGLRFHTPGPSGRCSCLIAGPSPAQCAYRELWGRINRPASWAGNPWVMVTTFKVGECK